MADTEPALAARAARADAFRTLADRRLDASYRLAYAILGQRAEAEDATHDAFVTAWRHWATLRDQALFERWFDRILINTCRNRLRQRARWRSHDLSAELPVTTPDALGPLHERSVLSLDGAACGWDTNPLPIWRDGNLLLAAGALGDTAASDDAIERWEAIARRMDARAADR